MPLLTAAGNPYGADFAPRGMRTSTDIIVVHCSATQARDDIKAESVVDYHMGANGWRSCGYNAVIDTIGNLTETLHPFAAGAHIGDVIHPQGANWNWHAYGVCMIGGINSQKQPEDNFTQIQVAKLVEHLAEMIKLLRCNEFTGHRQMIERYGSKYDNPTTPWNEGAKACPVIDLDTRVRPLVRAAQAQRHTVVVDPVLADLEGGKRSRTFAQWLFDRFNWF